MPYLAFLFICLCWGTSFILMDRAAHAFGPAAIGFGRMVGGAATIAIYCLAKRQWMRITGRDLLRLAFVALLANAFPYVAQPYVMAAAGEHAFFGMMVTLVPIATIAAGGLMLNQWPTSRQWIGVLGGLACTAIIVWDGTTRGMQPWLLALALCTPVSYAIGNTYLKWKLSHLPTGPLTTLFLALGAVLVLPVAVTPGLREVLHLGGPASPRDWPVAVASLVTLGVGSTGVAILAFVHLIQTQGPFFAGMVTYVVPMIALVWGQFDHEQLTGRQLAAIAGTLSMVALVQWNAATPAAPPPSSEPLA